MHDCTGDKQLGEVQNDLRQKIHWKHMLRIGLTVIIQPDIPQTLKITASFLATYLSSFVKVAFEKAILVFHLDVSLFEILKLYVQFWVPSHQRFTILEKVNNKMENYFITWCFTTKCFQKSTCSILDIFFNASTSDGFYQYLPPMLFRLTFVWASGKMYIMSGATYVSFQPTFHIAQNLTRCEPPTHHLHIQSIYNILKRGLVVLTHQLLSSPIFEYNTSCIMDVMIGRYFIPRWL